MVLDRSDFNVVPTFARYRLDCRVPGRIPGTRLAGPVDLAAAAGCKGS